MKFTANELFRPLFYLSIYLSIYLSMPSFSYLFVYQSQSAHIYLSIYLTGLYMEWEVSCRTAADLWVVAPRNCSKQHVAFLCSSHPDFILVSVHVVHPYSSMDTTSAWKNYRDKISIWSITVPAFIWRMLALRSHLLKAMSTLHTHTHTLIAATF